MKIKTKVRGGTVGHTNNFNHAARWVCVKPRRTRRAR
jgi:hypothetical protein